MSAQAALKANSERLDKRDFTSPLSMFGFTDEPRAGRLDSEPTEPLEADPGRGPVMSYPLNVVIHNILKEWEWRTGSPA